MATIVMTSEDDPMMAVVRYTADLAWSAAGPEMAETEVNRLCEEAIACISRGAWRDLANLMLTSAHLVSTRVSEKDIECIFTIICDLVKRTTSSDETQAIVELICAKIVQQPDDKPAVRVKILFNLYNLLENPSSKVYVYKKALELAASGKVSECIVPSFKKIDTFLKEWNVGRTEERGLFLAIANVLKDNKSISLNHDYFDFLNKYLATFSATDNINDAKEEAASAVIEFVRSSDLFQCDLLSLPAVAQLENDENYALVYQLLTIFLTKKLDAYLEFHASNSSFLEKYGLVHDECVTKMRLMSLLELSSQYAGEIPYAIIVDALQIAEEEVEQWIVKAITSKLLDCKIDQMNQLVIVSRHCQRVFTVAQWQSLRSKLGVWRENLANAISTIQANRAAIEERGQGSEALMIR